MTKALLSRLVLPSLICAVVLAGPVNAQTVAGSGAPAKNIFGQPDISGNWTNATLTSTSRPTVFGTRGTYTVEEVANLEGESERQRDLGNSQSDPNAPAPEGNGDVGGYNSGFLDPGHRIMRVGGEPRNSLFTTPNGQAPKSKLPGARAIEANPYSSETETGQGFTVGEDGVVVSRGSRPGMLIQTDDPEQRSHGERCLASFGRNASPPMLPNGFYNNNYQIVQSKDHVVILVEMVHDARIIKLTDKEHRPPALRPWYGDSVGWYEGDTLVVETTNFMKSQAFQGSWEGLKVTERFRKTPDDRLHYAFSVEDPAAWDAPWGGEYEFSKLDGGLYEYACHEGNYSMIGILAGSREHDKRQADNAAASKKTTKGSSKKRT